MFFFFIIISGIFFILSKCNTYKWDISKLLNYNANVPFLGELGDNFNCDPKNSTTINDFIHNKWYLLFFQTIQTLKQNLKLKAKVGGFFCILNKQYCIMHTCYDIVHQQFIYKFNQSYFKPEYLRWIFITGQYKFVFDVLSFFTQPS